ncbi:MAG: response regulator, partial [Myxococcales bacterium]|nr:response regulator [Myxococcales bacterium]
QIEAVNAALHKLNAQLRSARDHAVDANRAMSPFLANMSHELRTPLNAIIGYSELIRDELDTHEYDDASADLRHVESSARHLLNLIQDTLDLSKIEAGKMELTVETFDAGELLRSIAAAVEPMIRERGNDLVVALSDDIGDYTGDRTKFRQIFYNLLSNAAKFTDHGTIRLRAKLVDHGGTPCLLADVSDTGIGIPASKLPVIFGAFNQAEETTTRHYGGTGLGLTISRHYAEMMGGELSVDSIVHVGSTFTVRLPLQAMLDENPRPRLTLPDNIVLIADRDPRLHDLLRRRLGRYGFAALSAASYHDLLALTASLNPALVILDLALESGDEWSALAKLRREREPTPLILTGDLSARSRPEIRSLEADTLLARPVDVDRIIELALGHREAPRLGSISLLGRAKADDELADRLSGAGWSIHDAERRDLTDPPQAVVLDLRGDDRDLDALESLPWPSCPALLVVDGDERPELRRPHRFVDVRQPAADEVCQVCIELSALVHSATKSRP